MAWAQRKARRGSEEVPGSGNSPPAHGEVRSRMHGVYGRRTGFTRALVGHIVFSTPIIGVWLS
jgi:hypothetical protein